MHSTRVAVVLTLMITLASSPQPLAAAPTPALDTRLGIAEGFRNLEVMADIQAGWERPILPWNQIQPNGPDDFSNLGITISAGQLQSAIDRGVHVVGLLEFTPGWAGVNSDAGLRSPLKNLDLPFDNPNNYWGHFVAETARHYAGKIDEWVLWNEPEFHPGDPGAGGSFTWLGSDEQFAQLMKVGYLAIKKVNPNGHVSFPGTSYWIDLHRFVPLVRETQGWAPWPDDPTSLMPNWQVYQVAFDKPGNQRVTAIWNGDGAPQRVRIRKAGSRASAIDGMGHSQTVQEAQGWWVVDLAPATAHFPQDPDGYHFIGGQPLLLVEEGVDPGAPVVAPALGDPGSVPREFRLLASPRDGQTVSQGQAADFFVNVRGYEGFSDPVTFSLDHWSTQRVPVAQDPPSLPLQLSLPPATAPGQTGTIRIETSGAEPGIYFLTLVGTGGGQSKVIELALVVD